MIRWPELQKLSGRKPAFHLGQPVFLVCEDEEFGVALLPVVITSVRITIEKDLYTIGIVKANQEVVELTEDGEVEEEDLTTDTTIPEPDRPRRTRPQLTIVK
jgi:hypothetical protein